MRFIIYLLFCCLSIQSCSSIESDLKKMVGSSFTFNEGEMYEWKVDSVISYMYEKASYKLVIYADSSECSQCYLTHLEHWMKYIELENRTKGKFLCLFIIEAPKNMLPIVSSMVKIKHPLFFDEKFCLRHSNPQISVQKMLHVFLVDKNNKIIFVGNPIYNENIEIKLDSLLKQYLIQ